MSDETRAFVLVALLIALVLSGAAYLACLALALYSSFRSDDPAVLWVALTIIAGTVMNVVQFASRKFLGDGDDDE